MSQRGRSRNRGRSSGDFVSRYSPEHDDRTDPPQRDYNKSNSYRSRGGYRRNYSRGSGGGSHIRGSRGNNIKGNNYRGNRGRRPYGHRSGRTFDGSRNDASPFNQNEVDDDGDINMDGESESNVRFNPYSRPKPKHYDKVREQRPQRKSWYQLTIIDGSSYDEEWLKQEIQSTALIQYQPMQYHVDGNNVSFFLDDRSTAESIKDCSKKITSPDGNKIIILMRYCNYPPLEETQIEKIKGVLSGRYNAATQHLDVSSLFHDNTLKNDKVYVKLSTAYHMFVVTKIIAENISDLNSLDLSDNMLSNLDGLKLLVQSTPFVKKLNLKKNNVKSLKELEKLKEWDILELVLDQNPICGDYKSQTEYISDARDCFPNLAILDGHKLPPPVKFDLDKVELPKSIRDYFPPTSGLEIIKLFIQQYFNCYDHSRSMLTEAYSESAVFTMSIPSSPRGPSLYKYLRFSRNLKKMKNSSLKTSSVVTNRSDILAKIGELPSVKHLESSFCIDIPLVTSSIVNFIVRGLFKEGGREGFLRAFSRSFLCQVADSSLKIINEQYFVRNPTSIELKESKNLPATTSSAAVASREPVRTSLSQTEMIARFSQESGMNIRFSEQCLLENRWDYEAAGKVFLTLKNEGKIPPEAFVK